MQDANRLDGAGDQGGENGAVVPERVVVKPVGVRLDAAPLDRQEQRAQTQLLGQVEIGLKPTEMVRGDLRIGTVANAAGPLFPAPPVVGIIATFDLMGRQRRPPHEPF